MGQAPQGADAKVINVTGPCEIALSPQGRLCGNAEGDAAVRRSQCHSGCEGKTSADVTRADFRARGCGRRLVGRRTCTFRGGSVTAISFTILSPITSRPADPSSNRARTHWLYSYSRGCRKRQGQQLEAIARYRRTGYIGTGLPRILSIPPKKPERIHHRSSTVSFLRPRCRRPCATSLAGAALPFFSATPRPSSK